MNKPKILVVDDKKANILSLNVILEEIDCEIISALSGEQALKQVLENDFAVILLDVQMPEMDGFETAELIRGMKKNKYIPIIFITAINKEEKHIFKGYESGAVDYIFKPIEPKILISKVRIFLDLYNQKKILKDLNEFKDEVLSIVSHDLRSPLTIIKGATELISLSEFTDENVPDYIEMINNNIRFMVEMINNLLNVTKIQTGKFVPILKEINIIELIKTIIAEFKVIIKNKNIDIVFENAIDTLTLLVDSRLIKQVIINILDNAVKFSSNNDKIYIKTEETDFYFICSIKDNGPGIDKAVQTQIFEKFKQAESDPELRNKGLGLGLTICKEIIDLHKGTIEVNSELGEGTEFVLTFPKG